MTFQEQAKATLQAALRQDPRPTGSSDERGYLSVRSQRCHHFGSRLTSHLRADVEPPSAEFPCAAMEDGVLRTLHVEGQLAPTHDYCDSTAGIASERTIRSLARCNLVDRILCLRLGAAPNRDRNPSSRSEHGDSSFLTR